MKKLLLILTLIPFIGLAQSTNVISTNVVANQSFTLRGVKVTHIQKDSMLRDSFKIPTSKAVYDFVLGRINKTSWNVIGNTGTDDASDFIGTIDAQDIVFKANNTEQFRMLSSGGIRIPTTVDSTIGVIFKGSDRFIHNYQNPAMATNLGNSWYIGRKSGNFNFTGASGGFGGRNLAIGDSTLYANTTGYRNVAIGVWNATNNTTGFENTTVGANTFESNTTGRQNTAIGAISLDLNTTGLRNTAIGFSSMQYNITGDRNTAIGGRALQNSSSSFANVFAGFDAGAYNSTADHNTGVGLDALYYSNGSHNTAVGDSTLWGLFGVQLHVGYKNVAIGSRAGYHLGDTYPNYASIFDTAMTMIGSNSARDSSTPYTTSLKNSTAIGYDSRVYASNQMSFGDENITTNLFRGNVGIGTRTPDSALTVQFGTYFNRGIRAPNLPIGVQAKVVMQGTDGSFYSADTTGLFSGGGGSQDLQSVTNLGYTTTNDIQFDDGSIDYTIIGTVVGNGYFRFRSSTNSNNAIFANNSLSTDRTYTLPDASGTIALTSNIVYPGAGIAVSTGSAWGTSVTNNSSDWNTAYTDRMKWDGGATGLVAATGRTSLGLGQFAVKDLSTNIDVTGFWNFRGDLAIGTVGHTGLFYSGGLGTDQSYDLPNASGTLALTSDISTAISGLSSIYQPLDADLTTIAGLTATTDNFIVSVASTWASRTPTQVKTTLSLNNVENTALSTWAGTTNITTLGTIATGTWNGSTINYAYLGSGGGGSTKFLREDNTWQTISVGSGDMILASSQSVTGLKTFDKDKLAIKGTSTGITTISTGNTSATDYTFTLPAVNITAAQLTKLTTSASASTASVLMERDANGNTSVNNIVDSYTSTTTAAGTTTLTVSSTFYQNFSGTSTQTVTLPDATTLTNGHQYFIMDNSTGNVTINKNGGTLLQTLPANRYVVITLTDNSTSAGTWTVQLSTPSTEFIRQSSTYTLSSTTNIQKLFNASTNGALTVKATTTYVFEGIINISSMSGTSGNMKFDVLGAGTATITSVGWTAVGLDNSTIGTAAANGGSYTATNVSSGNITTAATGTAVYARIKGIITINAAGTLIPSIGLTTAAAAVVGVNTWMSFTEILPGGTNYTSGWN